MKKLMLLVAGGVGYVLGTRAGRERYEQIKRTATRVKEDPRVQEKAHQAADLAKDKAPVVKDKVAAAASTAADKVTPVGRQRRPPLRPRGAAAPRQHAPARTTPTRRATCRRSSDARLTGPGHGRAPSGERGVTRDGAGVGQ